MDPIVYRCGDCELDAANRIFRRNGTEYPLEPKVFAVLAQLVARPGDLLTRDQLLDAVWGHRYVTPSTLNRIIALARRSLADDAETPKFIQTVHGSGYRYIGAVERRVTVGAEVRVRFGPPPSARLPGRLHHLIGREHELAQIERVLKEGRSLTILGAGGMGKTQCALAFAHANTEHFRDGVWFFDLAPRRSAAEWLQTLALTLAITPSGERELVDRVAEALADRRALLLLDNCDRLSADMGELVVRILRGTEELKILATSQQQLGFVSERVMRMPPLALPDIRQPADAAELHEVGSAPAVALLLARIRDTQVDFELTAANAAAIVTICERLDGMPLALELAAARFSLLSAHQVAERLDHRFRFLVSDAAGRDLRHRNLVALLEWSFALLSPDEQRLLAWLSVFVQGWTVEAVITIANAFGTSPETAVDLLSGLASKSLASVDQGAAPPRYRLLESVREFALEQLNAMGEGKRARDAHLDYVLRMTEAAHEDMLGVRMRERIAQLMSEHGNIDAASEYAAGAGGNPQAALQIPGRLTLYFKSHGEPGLGIRLCERALGSAPRVASRERALALLCRGINVLLGRKVAADVPLLEAVGIARAVGDQWAEAYASGLLALWLIHVGQPQAAVPHLASIERLAESRDDDQLRGLAGLARGWLYLAEDDLPRSLAILDAVRMVGSDTHQHHFVGMYLGLVQFRFGNHAQAATEWHEAMRNAIAVGHLRGIAGSVEGCAYIAARLGHPADASRYLSAAQQMRERAGSPLFSFWVRHNEDTHAALRLTMGAETYRAALGAGVRMHAEDAMNEAVEMLRRFAAMAPLS